VGVQNQWQTNRLITKSVGQEHLRAAPVRELEPGEQRRRELLPLFQPIKPDTAETEQLMKLTSAQVKQTINQLGAQVLPDEHPAMPQLNSMFGEHTFFVDESGLKVLEPTPSLEAERQTGEVVSLADWSDAELTRLMAHEPEPTGVIVVFEQMKH
jgi:hypothetical protein